MSVALMVCFARSGGTILNRCLGSLPSTVVLSEVNALREPRRGEGTRQPATIRDQSEQWYSIRLRSEGYVEGILELERICGETGRRLVVREWTYVNYIPHERNGGNPPGRLSTLEQLKDRCDLRPFAFVRDAVDVWISRNLPPAEAFFPAYLRYVRSVLDQGLPVHKYEDFCSDPATVMRNLCRDAGLEYSDSFWDYASFDKVNGDMQIPGGSRGTKQGKIAPLPRKRIPWERIREVSSNPEMREANERLGYPPAYARTMGERIMLSANSRLRSLLRR